MNIAAMSYGMISNMSVLHLSGIPVALEGMRQKKKTFENNGWKIPNLMKTVTLENQ